MEQHHKQRARRRAQAHSAPLTDERFRVVVDEGERSSKNPVSGVTSIEAVKFSGLDSVQPYVGSATVCSNDVTPPTIPPNESSGIHPKQPIPIGAEGITPPSEAPPAKSPEEVKLRGWLLLAAGSVVVTGVGLFVAFTTLAPRVPVDAPALPAVMGVSIEATGDGPADRATPAAPAQQPSQPSQQQEEDDGSFVILEPSPAPRQWPTRTTKQTAAQPPPADTSTTSSKAGRRSPVIF
jgi:hypothetical protein